MYSTMASTSGDAHTSGRASYHRTSSSTRSITVSPVEHLQTIQSGIPAHDWDSVMRDRPAWVTRNDSIKGHYAGSVRNEGFTTTLKRGVGVWDSRKPDVWRAAAVELVATAGLTFLSITAYQQSSTTSVATRAFLQALIYALTVLTAAPISGGHLNPAITFTTFLTGRASLVRTLLYVAAQISGAIGGAAAARYLMAQTALQKFSGGGCLLQELPVESGALTPSTLTNRQGMLAEAIFSTVMLFVVYGIGFDSRSVVATLPVASPFIIGGVFGLLIFVSQGVGFTAVMNPARCIGPAVAFPRSGLWGDLCAFTLGPVIAAVVVGVFQAVMRPGCQKAECSGPVLPPNFRQAVVPDHQRPGFGPRSPGLFFPASSEDNNISAYSQQRVAPNSNASAMTSSELQIVTSEPNAAGGNVSKHNLTLQIKAFVQPRYSESRRTSTGNGIDGFPRFDQNTMLHQYSNSRNSSDGMVHHNDEIPERQR